MDLREAYPLEELNGRMRSARGEKLLPGPRLFEKMNNEILQCPSCYKRFPDLLAICEAGGSVENVGLALMAKCGECGCRWPVNKFWSKRETITLEAER